MHITKLIRFFFIMSLYDLHLGKAPKLHELLLLKYANGKELRIMEAVAPFWKKVANTLGFDEARIRAIEIGCHYQPEDATREMFCRWLEGDRHLKPATWSTLIQSLKDVKLTEIVILLSNLVCFKLPVATIKINFNYYYDALLMLIYSCMLP